MSGEEEVLHELNITHADYDWMGVLDSLEAEHFVDGLSSSGVEDYHHHHQEEAEEEGKNESGNDDGGDTEFSEELRHSVRCHRGKLCTP